MRRLAAATLLFATLAAAAHGAPPPPRPLSGCGVLALESPPAAFGSPLVLYREPGIERIAEPKGANLPRLAGSPDRPLLAVAARRGGWTQVAYDDAGRTGWLEPARCRRFLSWPEFLPGRTVRLLPGLKKGWYALKDAPSERGAERGFLGRDRALRVLATEDDWALVEAPSGWVRWRDPDGRLTISLQEAAGAEKR